MRSAVPSASASAGAPDPNTLPFHIIIDEVSVRGVWIARAHGLREQELVETRSSIRLAVTAAPLRKECERVTGVIKAAVTKVIAKRK